jgi:hypothetical protein
MLRVSKCLIKHYDMKTYGGGVGPGAVLDNVEKKYEVTTAFHLIIYSIVMYILSIPFHSISRHLHYVRQSMKVDLS